MFFKAAVTVVEVDQTNSTVWRKFVQIKTGDQGDRVQVGDRWHSLLNG